jgi:hypothetical protein
MADLKTSTKLIYKAILSLASNSISNSFKRVQDGDGENTGLGLSRDDVKSYGNLSADGNISATGTITASQLIGDGSQITGATSGPRNHRVLGAGSPYTLQEDDDVIVITGARNIQLPDPATVQKKEFRIVNTTANSIVIIVTGSTSELNGSSADKDLTPQSGIIITEAEDRYYSYTGQLS